ncbi:MAG: ImmA/IrrE family metallo-endopeptidase [Flavobacteriales bacterium]|nr:ImmA/IrrE family metallo-endopeptidase [Flavobacteriales bacterium]
MAFKNGILPRGFKAEAERIAVRYREELQLSKFAPLDAFRLAAHLEVVVIPVSTLNLPPECLGYLHGTTLNKAQWFAMTMIGEDGSKRVIHNDSVAPTRQQSDIMHELSHIICKHEHAGEDYSFGFPVRKYNAGHEAQAECLGATLQLPKPALLWQTKEGRTPEEIAEYYTASPAMVRRRLGESGVNRIRGYRLVTN